MQRFVHDLRYAVRVLGRRRLFAGVTVLTLGLGIGLVTALYAVITAVLLHPLATDQDRVVRIWKHDVERDLERHPVSYPEFRFWREEARSVADLAAINYADAWPTAILIDGRPEVVSVTPVSADFPQVVYRGAPLHGRWFDESDERPGAELVAVVSERFSRRIGNDSAIVGQRLTWAGGERTVLVIGVAPRAFDYPLGTDMWMPIARLFASGVGSVAFDIEDRRFSQFELVGRLSAGQSREQARAELSVQTGGSRRARAYETTWD